MVILSVECMGYFQLKVSMLEMKLLFGFQFCWTNQDANCTKFTSFVIAQKIKGGKQVWLKQEIR